MPKPKHSDRRLDELYEMRRELNTRYVEELAWLEDIAVKFSSSEEQQRIVYSVGELERQLRDVALRIAVLEG